MCKIFISADPSSYESRTRSVRLHGVVLQSPAMNYNSNCGISSAPTLSCAGYVPSYGASPTFIKPSDDFSHGLNERIPVSNIAPGINYYLLVLRALSK